MFKCPLPDSIKSGFKRAGKTLGALAVAGIITQLTPLCDFVHAFLPSSVESLLAFTGKSFDLLCTTVLGSILAGVHKTVSYK